MEERMVCKKEPIEREQVIAKYLSRALDAEAVEEFEGHYLGCDECFDELQSQRTAGGGSESVQSRLETDRAAFPCCGSKQTRS